MRVTASSHPDWDRLYATASAQEGLFTTKQAAEAGYSPQLLVHHGNVGKIVRLRRGIYRLVHFPVGEHEELVAAWLWSELAGVVSHQTALALHGLSDALPAHVADVPPEDRTWFSAVPTTNPKRSLNDCARAGLSPELLRQAAQQALRRGLVTKSELGDVVAALKPFGGLAA